ncbi:unnamed protein product, partial [Ectocarpus sp. 12 AP-2014]
RFISPTAKQTLLRRQSSQCNHSPRRIQFKPFASCDADHIVVVSRGGKTVPENTQLLCLTRHREESAHEMASCIKLFDLRLQ